MHDITNIPTLHRVINHTTQEVFTLFTKNAQTALKDLPIDAGDNITIEQIKVTTEDGCSNRIFQLKNIPISAAGIYFRTVNRNTLKVGKTVLIRQRNDYDRSTKKYCCSYFHDICKSRELKPEQWVITEFTF